LIITVLGARPQFIKAAVVSAAFKKYNIKETLVHTGQHYDVKMSEVFWKEMHLPKPGINFNIGSGHHGAQTAKMISHLEDYILKLNTEISAMMVYGDTNSTLAGAIVAPKLNIPLIHIEAGLRSFNKSMPEEINRIITDRISDYLFCSSETSVKQLQNEGITKNVFNVGDVMYDAFIAFSGPAEKKKKIIDLLPFKTNEYNLLTLHRPSNTDDPLILQNILNAFKVIDKPTVWPVHPRNKGLLNKIEIPKNILLVSPFSYLEMLVVIQNSYKVFTDSGGLQKEAYWAEKDCITIREETEWVETLENNFNILTGADTQKIIDAYYLTNNNNRPKLYGDGKAADKISNFLLESLHL
jgi:UDP-GlcNAc3NAcA epimerase